MTQSTHIVKISPLTGDISALNSLIAAASEMNRVNNLRFHPDYALLLDITDFLPLTAMIHQRLWHIQNNTSDIPTCCSCYKHVTWRKDTKNYNVYCSASCSYVDPLKIELKKAASLLKYGVDHPSKHDSVKQKVSNTVISRYGVSNAFWVNGKKQHIERLRASKNNHITKYSVISDLIASGYNQSQIGKVLETPKTFNQSTRVRSHAE